MLRIVILIVSIAFASTANAGVWKYENNEFVYQEYGDAIYSHPAIVLINPDYAKQVLASLETSEFKYDTDLSFDENLPKDTDGNPLALQWLENGWVLFQPSPDNKFDTIHWKFAETQAWLNKKGLWAAPKQDFILNANQLPKTMPTFDHKQFVIVQGVVNNVARYNEGSSSGYLLNFGDDAATDVTVDIGRDKLRNFAPDFDAESLEGKYIRVRGFAQQFEGPYMVIHTEDAIQYFEAAD